MNLLIGFNLGPLKIKGNIGPKGKQQGYFSANKWMEDNFVPFLIVQGYFRPFSVNIMNGR